MTLLTGDEYFPGGMSEFVAKKDEFLVFEEGPSVDVVLQWATYRDASDQTSLSRIWGGIHPPADDIPGRLIGEEIGVDAFDYALPYFNLDVTDVEESGLDKESLISVYPNPVLQQEGLQVQFKSQAENVLLEIQNSLGQVLLQRKIDAAFAGQRLELELRDLSPGIYTLRSSATGRGISVQPFVLK